MKQKITNKHRNRFNFVSLPQLWISFSSSVHASAIVYLKERKQLLLSGHTYKMEKNIIYCNVLWTGFVLLTYMSHMKSCACLLEQSKKWFSIFPYNFAAVALFGLFCFNLFSLVFFSTHLHRLFTFNAHTMSAAMW